MRILYFFEYNTLLRREENENQRKRKNTSRNR